MEDIKIGIARIEIEEKVEQKAEELAPAVVEKVEDVAQVVADKVEDALKPVADSLDKIPVVGKVVDVIGDQLASRGCSVGLFGWTLSLRKSHQK